jgi:hypothetical protein
MYGQQFNFMVKNNVARYREIAVRALIFLKLLMRDEID